MRVIIAHFRRRMRSARRLMTTRVERRWSCFDEVLCAPRVWQRTDCSTHASSKLRGVKWPSRSAQRFCQYYLRSPVEYLMLLYWSSFCSLYAVLVILQTFRSFMTVSFRKRRERYVCSKISNIPKSHLARFGQKKANPKNLYSVPIFRADLAFEMTGIKEKMIRWTPQLLLWSPVPSAFVIGGCRKFSRSVIGTWCYCHHSEIANTRYWLTN